MSSSLFAVDRTGIPIASILACIAHSQEVTIKYIVEACADDAERTTRLTSAVNRLAMLEADIMQAYAQKLNSAAVSSERTSRAWA